MFLKLAMFFWQDNFQKWNNALQTKDAATVASLYSTSDLSFLPTVSPQHIKKIGCTEDYFTAFVMKNPHGTITDDSVQVFGNGEAFLHSGMYTFKLGEADARTPVQARFSYVWRKINGDWKITHHHSSVRPEGPDMLTIARVSLFSFLMFAFVLGRPSWLSAFAWSQACIEILTMYR